MSTQIFLSKAEAAVAETDVLAAVRGAFEELAAGQAVQPNQVLTELPGGGDVIVYQAVLAGAGVHAIKVSPYIPQPEGKPVITAWTLLMSATTGEPLLLVDSAALTVERTAATTALGIDLLADPDARRLALVGVGAIGRAHLRYARLVRDFDDVRVFSRNLDPAVVEQLGDDVLAASSAADAVDGAEVVMLCTSAAEPVIDVGAIRGGVLVTSISTNAPRAHEIAPELLKSLDVYCDYTPAAVAGAGEMRIAAEVHGFTADDIRGDLPGLLAGSARPPSGERPVFFRSIGLGIEDAAVALAALGSRIGTR